MTRTLAVSGVTLLLLATFVWWRTLGSHIPNILAFGPPAVAGLLCLFWALLRYEGRYKTASRVAAWLIFLLAALPAILFAYVVL